MDERSDSLIRIRLAGLRARGWHGVRESERRGGQDFVVDVTIEAEEGEDTYERSQTVDYDSLAHDIVSHVSETQYNLIETLAHRLADLCTRDPRVVAAEVTVHKPDAPIGVVFDDVSVSVRRSRTSGSTP